jgi:hypothetical protein
MISEDKLFQAFVSPTFFINASGLLVLTLNTQLLTIISHTHTLKNPDEYHQLMIRAKLIRISLLFILLGIIGFMITCLLLGLNFYINTFYTSVSLFIISIFLVICGVIYYIVELISYNFNIIPHVVS